MPGNRSCYWRRYFRRDDVVFRARNGAPKIMTKFKDKPYSYHQLLPEYANGSKKFPTVKSMNWEGKSATAKVISEFTDSTPVVQRCSNPRSISRLVIVPKVSPGQAKDALIMDFACVSFNALINDFALNRRVLQFSFVTRALRL
jgi:hypothetical protein